MKGYKGEMIMRDTIETICSGSLIQHGKHNNRIYLMKLIDSDTDIIIPELSKLAEKNGYTKLFCKVPKQYAALFLADGYTLEAYIPKFYNKKKDVFFMSKFLDSERLLSVEKEQLNLLFNLLKEKQKVRKSSKKYTSAYTVRKLINTDVEQITEIYREVFETYPFPIHNPGYILKTMEEDVQYFGAELNGKLVALSSAEVDFKGGNAEMTDFATHAEHAGNNLSTLLLKAMGKEMKRQGIKTLYTIARLNSIAMNKTFLKNKYTYSGTLIKNTNIAGKIESMNIYYKQF